MHITVMIQDDIAYLSGVLADWKTFEDIGTLHQDVLSLDQDSQAFINALPHSTYITSETIANAYHSTLIANTTNQDTIASPPYISQGSQDWRAWLQGGADLMNNTCHNTTMYR